MEALWRNGEIPQLRNVSVRAACSGFKTLGQWWGWGAARKGFRVSTGSMLFCMLILVLLLLLFLKSL